MSLEFRGEMWTVNINLHVIKIYMVFKVMELDEIIKVGINGEEKV